MIRIWKRPNNVQIVVYRLVLFICDMSDWTHSLIKRQTNDTFINYSFKSNRHFIVECLPNSIDNGMQRFRMSESWLDARFIVCFMLSCKVSVMILRIVIYENILSVCIVDYSLAINNILRYEMLFSCHLNRIERVYLNETNQMNGKQMSNLNVALPCLTYSETRLFFHTAHWLNRKLTFKPKSIKFISLHIRPF